MKKTISWHYQWIKDILNGKKGYINFLLILIGTLIAGFSIYKPEHFYGNVISIIQNDYFLICVFITYGLNTINISNYILKNEYFVIRQKSYISLINETQKKVFLANIINLILILMIISFVSIIFSFGRLKFFELSTFNIYIFKICFNVSKLFLVCNILSYILYYINIIFEKNTVNYIFIVFILFFSLSLAINPHNTVTNFFNIPYIFSWCLATFQYNTFSLELYSFIMHFIIIVLIYIILSKYAMKYRGDFN